MPESNIKFIPIQNKSVIVLVCFVLFIVCLYIYVCECLLQNNNQKIKHKNNTNCGSAFEPGASGLPYHCAFICVRSWCNWRTSSVDSKPKKNGDLVKAKISGEDPRATGGFVSNLFHPRFNKTKQHTENSNQKKNFEQRTWNKTKTQIQKRTETPLSPSRIFILCLPVSTSLCRVYAFDSTSLSVKQTKYKQTKTCVERATTACFVFCSIFMNKPWVLIVDTYLCHGAYSKGSNSIFISSWVSYEYIHHVHIKMLNFVWTSPSHMCVLQTRLDPHLLHQPARVHVCVFTPRLWNKNEKINMNK